MIDVNVLVSWNILGGLWGLIIWVSKIRFVWIWLWMFFVIILMCKLWLFDCGFFDDVWEVGVFLVGEFVEVVEDLILFRSVDLVVLRVEVSFVFSWFDFIMLGVVCVVIEFEVEFLVMMIFGWVKLFVNFICE